MIYDDESAFRITGSRLSWCAEYSADRFDGPLTFSVADQAVVLSCQSSFDDLKEELVLPEGCRVYRKGKGAVFTASGRLPIGSGLTLKHTHRYSDSAVKITKDIFVPAKSICREHIALDNLVLAPTFTLWRELTPDFQLTEWEPLTSEPVSWADPPLALILKNDEGFEIEVGVGNDVWRWSGGLMPSSNTSSYTLRRGDEGVEFLRNITVVNEDVFIDPRSYRFSWYMAWSDGPALALPDDALELPFRPNGDVALGSLNKAMAASPGRPIVLDLLEVPWPEKVKRSASSYPCFASSQTIKKLKRVIRQLASFEGEDLALHVTNLRPGSCQTAAHVHGKSDRHHWDMASILDFAVWTRQCLGNDWTITCDSTSLPLPSLREPFAPTDHEVPPVEYEYIPPDV